MIKSAVKKFVVSCVFELMLANLFGSTSAIKIVLDPGHGGESLGCVRKCDDREILEKDLNYKIASAIKESMNNYVTKDGDPVDVYLTRDDSDSNPLLSERVSFGSQIGADAVISLHINASANIYRHGTMVLATASNCNGFYDIEDDMARCFLNELSKLGLEIPYDASGIAPDGSEISISSGVLRRLSNDGSVYENGDTTDWYGIVSHGISNKIPAIIVEHAYLSNDDDYQTFLSDDDKLKELSDADVMALVKYFDLVKKSDGQSSVQSS